jgi:hypothetical protein
MKEREMWHLLYSEFSTMVRVEHWSGADALVMSHFSTVLESEREQYRDELFEVLTPISCRTVRCIEMCDGATLANTEAKLERLPWLFLTCMT